MNISQAHEDITVETTRVSFDDDTTTGFAHYVSAVNGKYAIVLCFGIESSEDISQTILIERMIDLIHKKTGMQVLIEDNANIWE